MASLEQQQPTWIDVNVAEVRRESRDDPTRRQHAVVLKEVSGERRIGIIMAPETAMAIARALQSVDTPRPMTYQFAANLVAASGSQVSEVRISRLDESTFVAVVVVEGPSGATDVDARPSDALNLALVCDAPIRIDAALLDDPDAASPVDWRKFPTRESELVAEWEETRREMLAMLHKSDK